MQIALITSTANREDAPVVDAALVASLNDRNVTVAFPAWDDETVNWAAFDAALVRTTWNYQYARERFVDTLDAIATVTTLFNSPSLIRWNTHKQYLVDLEERGVPVVPTVVLPRNSKVSLASLATTHGFEKVVIKPAVGAGGRGVVCGGAHTTSMQAALVAINQHEDVIVQPYIETVATRGEISLIVCGGVVSHAVTKAPASGDFRAHERYGARYLAHSPTPNQAALACWVATLLHPHTPLIARIDVLTDANDTLYVSEVELTEPNLYLTLVPKAATLIATTLIKAVNQHA